MKKNLFKLAGYLFVLIGLIVLFKCLLLWHLFVSLLGVVLILPWYYLLTGKNMVINADNLFDYIGCSISVAIHVIGIGFCIITGIEYLVQQINFTQQIWCW